ncbi:unnamed protein product [Lactuca virosa]|uniref:Uncharacterized protein n=1 Tax=Lactuca virosa TaxID=75947 RepID=A0AAU9M939_9ASTR|nr:unnamed protein product [Lactuca virosa]
MFFDVVPCMVWMSGCMFKLEVMGRELGVPAGHQYSSVMEQDPRLFLSSFLDHHPGNHDTSAGDMSLGCGCGSTRGFMFKLEVMDNALGVPAGQQYSGVIKREARIFIFVCFQSSTREPRYECGWYACGSWMWIIYGWGLKLELVSYGFEKWIYFLMFFDVGPCMLWVWGCIFKLEVMDHALGVSAGHQYSSFIERDARLFHLCVLDHQPWDHGTSTGSTSVSHGCGSFGVGVISSI